MTEHIDAETSSETDTAIDRRRSLSLTRVVVCFYCNVAFLNETYQQSFALQMLLFFNRGP